MYSFFAQQLKDWKAVTRLHLAPACAIALVLSALGSSVAVGQVVVRDHRGGPPMFRSWESGWCPRYPHRPCTPPKVRDHRGPRVVEKEDPRPARPRR